jgi:hypothetical protein
MHNERVARLEGKKAGDLSYAWDDIGLEMNARLRYGCSGRRFDGALRKDDVGAEKIGDVIVDNLEGSLGLGIAEGQAELIKPAREKIEPVE